MATSDAGFGKNSPEVGGNFGRRQNFSLQVRRTQELVFHGALSWVQTHRAAERESCCGYLQAGQS